MKKILLFLCALILIVIYYSCSEDSPSQSAVYIPQVENQWHAENNIEHTFQLSTEDNGLNKGIIYGFETYPDSFPNDNSDISGFFLNRDIQFIVERPTGPFKFEGTIVNENRIELNSPAGAFVLVK